MSSKLPSNWVLARLHDAAEIITGGTPPTSYPEYYGGTIPFIKPPALSGKRIGKTSETISELGAKHTRIVPAGSVLVSCIGVLGKTGITTEPSAFNQQINALVFGPSVLPLFGFYFCQTLRLYLESVASATTISIVNKSKFSEALIPIPPLPEQERIVAEIEKQFTRLDVAVEYLRHAQVSLKNYRASVLKAACEGRLVPTEAELARAEGRGYETAERYVRHKGSSDQDVYWPFLPEGWLWTRLSHIGQVTGGLTKNPARSIYTLKLPYLRVANVYANRLALDDIQQIGIQENEIERGLLQKNDLLIVEGNGSIDQIGRVALWDGSISPCVHQNHIIKVRFLDADLARYALLWLLSPEGRSQIVRVASSTTGLHTLSISKVGNLPIPLPPPGELPRIIAEAERRTSIIQSLEQTCSENLIRAQSLRQAMLYQAFSGKLALQDPNDEPATALLERIRETRSPASRTDGAAATEPDSGKPLFVEQDPSSQTELAWEILFGRGIFEKEDAVREIAQGLREKGLAQFQRLRQGGPLFNEISSAVDRGVRQGFFDRPRRGYVRAILSDPKAYSPDHWRLCLLGALDGEPVEEEDALRAAAEWARENMGLEFARLREDGVILQGLRAALKEAVKRGEINRKRGKVFRSTNSPE